MNDKPKDKESLATATSIPNAIRMARIPTSLTVKTHIRAGTGCNCDLDPQCCQWNCATNWADGLCG